MTAYAIFIRNSIKDADAMKTYGGLAPKSIQAFAEAGGDVKALAAYGPIETIEGDKSDGVVLLQFKTMADAKSWYDSPAYQEALPHRLRGSDYRVLFFEGL